MPVAGSLLIGSMTRTFRVMDSIRLLQLDLRKRTCVAFSVYLYPIEFQLPFELFEFCNAKETWLVVDSHSESRRELIGARPRGLHRGYKLLNATSFYGIAIIYDDKCFLFVHFTQSGVILSLPLNIFNLSFEKHSISNVRHVCTPVRRVIL